VFRRILIVCVLGHLLLIFAVCARDIFFMIAGGYTSLPHVLSPFAQGAETAISSALGEQLPSSNALRRGLNLYLRASGIDVGYGFFAPNVPDNYKVIFQLRYPDGRVDYQLPSVANIGAGLRLSTLIDNIGEAQSDQLQEVLLKMMAYSVWREHPDAVMIRAVLGFVLLPSPDELKRGLKESYQTTRAYDFVFPAPSGPR
jgi:hypothetical protein